MKIKNTKLVAKAVKAQMEFSVLYMTDGEYHIRELTENLATILKLDNPKFDRDKFINSIYFDALSREAKECGL